MKATDNGIITNSIKPMDTEEGKENGEKYKFSVQGYNDSKKDIHYGIYLNYGEEQENKQRFKDEDIMVYLTETKKGVTKDVFGPGRLTDFNDTIIYSNIIDGNIKKEDKVTIDYELTVWLSDNVLISDTETSWEGKNIYTSEEYKNSYISLDVKVEGDFVEKEEVIEGTIDIKGYKVDSEEEYDLNTRPMSEEDIRVVISSTKEIDKVVIASKNNNLKEELEAIKNEDKWEVSKVISESDTFTYYIIYKDGKISSNNKFQININPDRYTLVDKPTNSLCIERVYNGESQELVSETEGYTLENNSQIDVGNYQITA